MLLVIVFSLLSILRYGHAYEAFKLLLTDEDDIWAGIDIEEPLKVSSSIPEFCGGRASGYHMILFRCKDVSTT